MDKFGRNYHLKIGVASGTPIEITLPFTIEFDITRNTLTSANVCQIRIYNLSAVNRNQIRFNASDYGQFRAIELRAGYGQTNLPIIFTGNISQAWSVREGVNFITQIECYDGGFAFVNGKISQPFAAGTTYRSAIKGMAETLPNVTVGAIGNFADLTGNDKLVRGNSYSGNTMKILGEQTGGAAFIDLGRFNALKTNEFIAGAEVGGLGLINSKSGLLNTPVLEHTIVRFDMIFEPSLVVAQRIRLDSLTKNNFNGDYKVTAIKHRGMISEAVCGNVVTTGEFFYTKLLVGVRPGA